MENETYIPRYINKKKRKCSDHKFINNLILCKF